MGQKITPAVSLRNKRLKHPAFTSYNNMHTRCYQPSHAGYKNYGGRNITVCKRWSIFKNFLEDMGERPKGLTLDRIDVNGNYCKSNCRWVSMLEQAKNKRVKAND